MDSDLGRRASTMIFTAIVFLSFLSMALGIDCFKCVFMHGRFSACDNPFHNNHSLQTLESLHGDRKRRDGLNTLGIDCFKCVSMNGRFSACDDPFHNNHSLQTLESLHGDRKRRDGLNTLGIDCFKCVSMNGRFSACDDPFHNNHSLQTLESLHGDRKRRDGLNTLGIDCFKCVSMNGRFSACDDPFHNNHSLQMLESPCMGGRKGRDGLFPATSCIKIAGVFDDTGESITVRGCGLDSGTATTDTEIIRMSHCGRFYYNDRYVHGCLQSCNDADACNSSQRAHATLAALLMPTLAAILCRS